MHIYVAWMGVDGGCVEEGKGGLYVQCSWQTTLKATRGSRKVPAHGTTELPESGQVIENERPSPMAATMFPVELPECTGFPHLLVNAKKGSRHLTPQWQGVDRSQVVPVR